MSETHVRHILSLSGGKDSTALAVYLRNYHRQEDIEYVFCDTGKELPETYEYLARLELYLRKPIVRLHDDRGFKHWLRIYGNYLPSSSTRWCTRHLKIQPFERHIGSDPVRMYIGIRADEDREGYISHKPNIEAVYPFKEDGLVKQDIFDLLEEAGLDLPKYYEWRSRSGCYFCFFQQKIEWAGLLERHPDLFEEARALEQDAVDAGCPYTWSQHESLAELSRPERVREIRKEHRKRVARERRRRPNKTLLEVFCKTVEDQNADTPCLICDL